MLSSSVSLLCLILHVLYYALAGPHVVKAAFSPVLVPLCAQDCLQKLITTSFAHSACASSDLQCLCTKRSASGFTLGEGATQCVAGCPQPAASDYENAYDLCSGIPNAALATHKTITASMASPSTVLIDGSSSLSITSTPTSNLPTSGIITDTASDPVQTNFSIFFSGTLAASSRSSASTSPLSTSTTAAAAAATSTPPLLTTGQIAGVAVGGAAVLFGALGLLAFLFFAKRRKATWRDSGSSFGNDRIEGGLQTPLKKTPPTASSSGFGSQNTPIASKASELLGVPPTHHERTLVPTPQRGGPRQALSPFRHDLSSEASPISVSSYRTTARLLPDKPTISTVSNARSSSLHPGQEPKFAGGIGLKLTGPTPPQSVADPRYTQYSGYSALQGQVISRKPSDPFLSPDNDPRAMMYAMERQRASNKDLPPLITTANRDTRNAWSPASSSRPPLPIPTHLPNNHRPNQAQTRQLGPPVEFSQRYDPSAGFARNPSLLRNPYVLTPPPVEAAHYTSIAPVKSYDHNDRPHTNYTNNSETDFEDEPDSSFEGRDHVPHLLSPVAEAETPRRRPTPQRTPLSQLRYPPVPTPRSSPRTEQTPISPETPGAAINVQPALVSATSPSPLSPYQNATEHTGPFELPERSTSWRAPPPRLNPMASGAPGTPEANEHLKGSATYKLFCAPGYGEDYRGRRAGQQNGAQKWKKPSPKQPYL